MLRSSSLLRYGISIVALSLPSMGCQLLLGIGNEEPLEMGGAGGTGGTGATGGAGGATGGTGGATGGTGGATGGSGGGAPTEPWQKVFLGAVYGGPVAIDAQGNIVLAVSFYDGVDFGDGDPVIPQGNGDVAILKFDKAGTLVWKRVFNAPDTQSAQSIAVGPGGEVAFGGDTFGDVDFGKGVVPQGAFVVKLASDGTTLWSLSAVAAAFQPTISHVAIDSQGNVIVGSNGGAIDFGDGVLSSGDSQSFYVAKLDATTGQPLWSKITKNGTPEQLVGLTLDSSDSIVLTGSWKGPYLGLAAAGETPPNDLYNNTNQDAIFLLRLDPGGDKSDGKMIAGQNAGFLGGVSDMDVDAFGWGVLVGTFSGPIVFEQGSYDAGPGTAGFIVRDQITAFDQWTHAYLQDGTYVGPGNVAVDGADNMAITASYQGAPDLGGGPLPAGPQTQVVFELDKAGAFRWSHVCTFGDGGIQNVAAGSLEDETVFVGSLYGASDLGFGVIDEPQAFFIVRLAQ
jgi:hypothetical protein